MRVRSDRTTFENADGETVSLAVLRGSAERILDGVEPGSPAAAIAERQGGRVLRAIVADRSVANAIDLTRSAAAYSDAMTAGLAEHIESLTPDCCKGCSHCCHLVNIAVAVPEALSVAEHVRARWSVGELDGLQARVQTFLDHTEGLTYEQRAHTRHPCPMLIDDSCSVYEVRPLACRGWNSLDVSKCEEDHHQPERHRVTPVYVPQLDIARSVRIGLYAGIRCAGLQHDRVHFIPALSVALYDPNAGEQWVAGGPFLESGQAD